MSEPPAEARRNLTKALKKQLDEAIYLPDSNQAKEFASANGLNYESQVLTYMSKIKDSIMTNIVKHYEGIKRTLENQLEEKDVEIEELKRQLDELSKSKAPKKQSGKSILRTYGMKLLSMWNLFQMLGGNLESKVAGAIAVSPDWDGELDSDDEDVEGEEGDVEEQEGMVVEQEGADAEGVVGGQGAVVGGEDGGDQEGGNGGEGVVSGGNDAGKSAEQDAVNAEGQLIIMGKDAEEDEAKKAANKKKTEAARKKNKTLKTKYRALSEAQKEKLREITDNVNNGDLSPSLRTPGAKSALFKRVKKSLAIQFNLLNQLDIDAVVMTGCEDFEKKQGTTALLLSTYYAAPFLRKIVKDAGISPPIEFHVARKLDRESYGKFMTTTILKYHVDELRSYIRSRLKHKPGYVPGVKIVGWPVERTTEIEDLRKDEALNVIRALDRMRFVRIGANSANQMSVLKKNNNTLGLDVTPSSSAGPEPVSRSGWSCYKDADQDFLTTYRTDERDDTVTVLPAGATVASLKHYLERMKLFLEEQDLILSWKQKIQYDDHIQCLEMLLQDVMENEEREKFNIALSEGQQQFLSDGNDD